MSQSNNHDNAIRIGVVGLGHVGLPTALGFAQMGWEVLGADADSSKARMINSGTVPFYEPGVEELLKLQLARGKFRVCDDVSQAIVESSVLFLCVGTPQGEDGRADLRDIESLARLIARNLNGYKLIVEKSTVPVITAQWIKKTIHRYARTTSGCSGNEGGNARRRTGTGQPPFSNDSQDCQFELASNPEFLQEGKALEGIFHPSRIVCGVESDRARAVLGQIYQSLACPIIYTDLNTAELIKHAANAFLCTKISFINMVANLCEEVGGDATALAQGIGLDPRIGRTFFESGIGFGGYCFPKDLRAFIRMAEDKGVDFSFLKEVEGINKNRVPLFVEKVRQALWVINGKTIGVLGLSFKPGTDDIREAPGLKIIEQLQAEGARLRLYDPHAMPNTRKRFAEDGERVTYCSSAYSVAENADAVVLLTEWPEFLELDLAELRSLMAVPILVDGRNALDPARALEAGFDYVGIGRSSLLIERTEEAEIPCDPSENMIEDAVEVAHPRLRSFVTGGAGFLGSHLCDRLLREGHEVICCDNVLTGDVRNIEHLRNHPRFAFVRQDVILAADLPLLASRTAEWRGRDVQFTNRLDYVFHLASPASPKHYAQHPIPTLKVGAFGTWNTLELARNSGASFLLASTSEVYGDPEVSPQPETYWGRVNPIGPRSVYDEAKRYAEALTTAYGRNNGVQIHIARIFNTYGERMREDDGRALPNFMMQALRGKPLTVYGDGGQTRSLCYVSDTVEGLLRLMVSDESGPVNIGNPEEISMNELAERVIEITETRSGIEFVALPQDDPTHRCPDISRAITRLGWRPQVTLREGLVKVLPYFKSKLEELCVK